MGISIIKIRRSHDRLLFMIEIHTRKDGLYIEISSGVLVNQGWKWNTISMYIYLTMIHVYINISLMWIIDTSGGSFTFNNLVYAMDMF